MWRRGADADGYVANFVETEQIVQMNGYTSSFVQVLFLTRFHIVNSLMLQIFNHFIYDHSFSFFFSYCSSQSMIELLMLFLPPPFSGQRIHAFYVGANCRSDLQAQV